MAVSKITCDGWIDSGLGRTGSGSVDISSLKFHELCVAVNINNGGNMQLITIPKLVLSSSTKWFRDGANNGVATGTLATVSATLSLVTLINASLGNTDYTSTTTMKIYYR